MLPIKKYNVIFRSDTNNLMEKPVQLAASHKTALPYYAYKALVNCGYRVKQIITIDEVPSC